ncbi:MAG: hypothetical protein OXC54_08805 [Rhodospirillaceae bacterium]|nr:hypothetical protein [Rhodospirillaceae bacterium]
MNSLPQSQTFALREMATLRDRLEALEGQFHLPPETVPVEDRLRGEPGFGEGGEDDRVLHERQRRRLRSSAGPGRLPAKLLKGDPDRRVGIPDRADPSVDGGRRPVPGPRPCPPEIAEAA